MTEDKDGRVGVDHDKRSVFKKFPDDLKPGALYSTPELLANSGSTRYTSEHIRYFYRTHQLPGAFRLGRQIILLEEAVEYVIDRDQRRASGELKLTGVEPGTRRNKRGRQRLSLTPIKR